MKRNWFTGLIVLLLLISHSAVASGEERQEEGLADQLIEDSYHDVLLQWKNEKQPEQEGDPITLFPSGWDLRGAQLLEEAASNGYGDQVVHLERDQQVEAEVEVEASGFYQIHFDYYIESNPILPVEIAVQINGEYPFYESRRISFMSKWMNDPSYKGPDENGNERIPTKLPISEWSSLLAEDASHLHDDPLLYWLDEGSSTITLSGLRGEVLLGEVSLEAPEEKLSYEEYSSNYKDTPAGEGLVTIEAEKFTSLNSSHIRPEALNDPDVVPYENGKRLLNVINAHSWSESGQEMTWEVEAPKDGLYAITMKVKQNKGTGGPVFRTLEVNGEVPFKEVQSYLIPHSTKWQNVTFGDKEEKPYLFFLKEGSNELSLKASAAPYQSVVNDISSVMAEIDELALSIRKLTGNQRDRSRSWEITEYIPEIETQLIGWADRLNALGKEVQALTDQQSESKEFVSIALSEEKLRGLAAKPNEIPVRMTELSEGSNSVSQLLANLMIDMTGTPLSMDRFYFHGEKETIPDPSLNWWASVREGVKSFFASFSQETLATSQTDEETLNVWVNRPRQYVELMQTMVDESFTAETGIKVKLSLMPDEQKLILASSAGTQPDLALGVSNWLPYEMAIRGAVEDLRQFDDFTEYSKQFSPGAFLPMMVDEGVYGLPETQDFFVQFYRKDILNELNTPVPDTWNDVIEILPELQRYGMNYYTPIAGAIGFKPFQTTAPYIYQFQGDMYAEDGMSTAIDEEAALNAVTFMTDLNTIYSMPLQVPNFYNHFRYSTLPIGISSFTTYVQLTSAAPEIAGWWDIALHPGIENEEGEVERWTTGSGQSDMILKGTDKPDESWELLKWWMSADTQTEFANTLQVLFGPEYMWNTANLDAFVALPWPEEHKEIILEQWEYLKEVPKIPGAYLVERELSNIWNRIVFDGENPRSAIDDSIIAIDREITRKMEEFGYVENGVNVKPYRVPTIEMVESWGEEE
ncbi:extracellular solute-binding protein [Jeotgalibacillus proteolyticus]|uniref:ABC transporter substrate-binding protein n=1 Tax=Jeotgalibacillus proteolyticus TaxID=2082395 RepID=A0A2S5GA30_9BACL|nr:extracellular solute-binding protein [Jeotgalibacillus proteolyticus]PPA69839.1 ABC transporter substrate-binding protein [Jeotgalibacillus proteolyticus]